MRLLVQVLLILFVYHLPFCSSITQIDPWGLNSLRVRISQGSIVQVPAVQALLPQPPDSFKYFRVDSLGVSNGNLQAIDSGNKIDFYRISDKKLLVSLVAYSFGAPVNPVDPKIVSATARFSYDSSDKIVGLGEHRTGQLFYNNYVHSFQKSQVYQYSIGADVSIPFYTSTGGYGFLWNLPSFGSVSIQSTFAEWQSNATQQIDFWITTTNPDSTSPYADIISNYADAVGHPLELPWFASGFWQCKNRYRNQTEILDIAQGYYDRSLPLSIIVVDYFHWIHFGDWRFNPACWPSPSAMVSDLNNHGTEVMVSVWPLVDPTSDNFAAMEAHGYLVKNASGQAYPFHNPQYSYDPFNPAAREFVWSQVKAGYYDNGIKVYWLDASEPERFLPDQSGTFYYYLGRDLEVGMAFPFMHHQTFYNGLKSAGETEIIVLSRSAWAGSQRYGAAVWSGDIPSTFAELAIQVKVAQNMAMSGIYWWTTDIGGYGGGNIDSPNFQELIVRWFQFGAFCPLFRLHGDRQPNDPDSSCGGSGGPNEVWRFGPTAYGVISKIILLREQLREYVMTHMKIASTKGIPVLRPMFFDWPQDPTAYLAEDQFMFGPDWLVAPVTVYRATSRSVYLPRLPANQVWTHYYTGETYPYGFHVIPTNITNFPLFFRKYVAPTVKVPAVQFYSNVRNDSVLCVSQQCFDDNTPDVAPYYYKRLRVEGYAVLSVNPNTVPLNLWFSFKHNDNYVATTSNPPDSSYTVNFGNGFVFSQPDQGLISLDLYYNKDRDDHLTVASAEGHSYAKDNGYQFVSSQGYIYAQNS